MRRIRIERKAPRPREDRSPVLPIDPRDPDIARVKRTPTGASKDHRL